MSALKNLSLVSIGTVVISLGTVAPVKAATFYEITGLDFLPSDINDKGEVVGEQYLWQAGKVTDLTTLPGANGSPISATAINNNGKIVGGGLNVDNFNSQAFISDGNTISDLPRNYFCEEFCPPITAQDINDLGTISLSYDDRVVLKQTSYGATIDAIGTRSLFNSAINNQDRVVATGTFSGIGIKGVLEGGNYLIPATDNFEDPLLYLYTTTTNDIDDSGNIVGSSSNSFASEGFATLWEDFSQPGFSLGALGGNSSNALGINNLKQVVGSSSLADNSTQHAFLWENGELIDINSLVDSASGWELTSALEINNNGDIIGIGNFNGEQRGFVAKSVPEPTSTLGVLGLGLFGLVSWRKRRLKS